MPLPDATSSKWPAPPHTHGIPTACEQAICPISPAKPWLPRTKRPWAITAPPMPVPAAIIMQVSAPLAAPQRASPSAWACTSLSTDTGSSQDSCKRSLMGWPVHPGMISLAYAMPPVTASTRPAVDTPMPSTCSRRERASASTVFATSHTVTSTGPPPRCACVGTWVSNTTSGAASICSYRSSAPAIFVPPISSAATYAGYSMHPTLPFSKSTLSPGVNHGTANKKAGAGGTCAGLQKRRKATCGWERPRP